MYIVARDKNTCKVTLQDRLQLQMSSEELNVILILSYVLLMHLITPLLYHTACKF